MKDHIYLITLLLLFSFSTSAQKIDSVRQVIKEMGYDLPRLSPVAGFLKDSKAAVMSLDGTWQFSPDSRHSGPAGNIEVPGEWVMQGFSVKPGIFASYKRQFRMPSDWKGNRIKLRCDAVYSECEIFVNGKRAGDHLGGFTAFETDITDLVLHGKENSLSINVRSESIADSLASGSKYAVHQLGGISRKIYLMALPEMNCSMFHVSTFFDENYLNATLNAEVELTNESDRDERTSLRFELRRDGNKSIIFTKDVNIDGVIKANSSDINNFIFDVKNPLKWDPEHPYLYVLKLSVISGGKVSEVIERIVGFRQIEVHGNQVFVNNMPVKLRGVCRHEVMPLRGRSLSPGQWEEDVKLFREANINYIRTSHYPPAPELIEACDRLGMFVEVEGPFCWAHETKVPERLFYEALVQPELEMVNTFRSNPSVLMWSLANESDKYKEYFSRTAALVKAVDPTRPRNFSQWGSNADNGELEIDNHHYPGPTGPEKYANAKRPVTFDEYCHLNAYNRFELVTDPGLRDAWGIGFEWMWEKMYKSKGVLGGALWAAIDDSFILPDGRPVGYGTWGPVDGWRRPKPEYWHVKKVYSPVKIRQTGNRDTINGIIEFEIENRMLFTDLAECKFSWRSGDRIGTFGTRAKPGETVIVNVSVPPSEKVYIEVAEPRGMIVDKYEFTIIPALDYISKTGNEKTTRTEDVSEIKISSGRITMVIDKRNNSLKEILSEGTTMILGDAKLMVLALNGEGNGIQMTGDTSRFEPFTATCKNRVVTGMEQFFKDDGFILRIFDSSEEARGFTEYLLASGELKISYQYEMRMSINPRQTGMVFNMPDRFQTLEWERMGQWNFYPDDHIGRLKGKAPAKNKNPHSGPAGPIVKPGQVWASDQNEIGTNDFRSTKRNIAKASLSDGTDKINIVSDGTHSIRCWLSDGNTRMLVASYSNMGAERFLKAHAEIIERPLKPGDIISGTVHMTFSE